MSSIENIEHSLMVINEIGAKTDDALENKKSEISMAAGGVISAGEVLKVHKEFMDKNKADLISSVKEGKLSQEIAQLMMNVSAKSQEIIRKFLTEKLAQHNIKKGEALALENSVKLLKSNYDILVSKKKLLEAAKLEALEAKNKQQEQKAEVAVAPISFETLVEEKDKKPVTERKRRTKRPDEVEPMATTVRRLKESRKKRNN